MDLCLRLFCRLAHVWPHFVHKRRKTGRLIVLHNVFHLSSSLSMPCAWPQDILQIHTQHSWTKAGVRTLHLPRRTCGLDSRLAHPSTAGISFLKLGPPTLDLELDVDPCVWAQPDNFLTPQMKILELVDKAVVMALIRIMNRVVGHSSVLLF